MKKVVEFLTYNIYTQKDAHWRSVEEDPPPADLLVIFYNIFLDEYRVTTLEKLEEDFKFIRTHFGDLIDEKTGDEEVDYQLSHTFHPTHWMVAPQPPFS